ncbi:MAG: hypothetical protein EZS28_044298, partial [Streblomastix strix]
NVEGTISVCISLCCSACITNKLIMLQTNIATCKQLLFIEYKIVECWRHTLTVLNNYSIISLQLALKQYLCSVLAVTERIDHALITGIGKPLSIILVIVAALSSLILSLNGRPAALIISLASYEHLSSDAGLPRVLSHKRIFPLLLLDSWNFHHYMNYLTGQIVVPLAFLMVKVTFPPPTLQMSACITNYALVIESTYSAALEISNILLVVTAINRANVIPQSSTSSILSIDSTLRRICLFSFILNRGGSYVIIDLFLRDSDRYQQDRDRGFSIQNCCRSKHA